MYYIYDILCFIVEKFISVINYRPDDLLIIIY